MSLSFDTSARGTADITETNFKNYCTVDGSSVKSVSLTKIYADTEGPIRISTGSAAGSMTITFNDSIVINNIAVECRPYQNSWGTVDQNCTLSVKTSAHTSPEKKSIDSEDLYVYESIASSSAATSITLSAESGKRVCIYSITLNYTGSPSTVEWGDPATGTAPTEKTKIKQTYHDQTDWNNNAYSTDSCPTEGEAKLLIVPIWFTDSSNYITNKNDVRSDIEKAYLGTTEDTGWHSVKSFYEEESKGKLTLDATVTDWYSVEKASSTFGPEESGGDETTALVQTVADWYFAENPGANKTDYDCDSDGFYDGIMLIYGAPDYESKGSSDENLWAYCYWIQPEDIENPDPENPIANTYFWASYDFMYDSSTASTRTGKSNYGGGDCSHVTIDAHTYIHEMGHVFGLDDYYDYGSNGYQHAGGFSMQDANVGGHDPYSVMSLGWADPYVPTESCVMTIGAFQKTHDLILLSPSFNSKGSAFDQYLLLELYTPTGLNELDSQYTYSGNYPKGPSVPGIRLWHVDSRLVYYTSEKDDGSLSQLTTDVTKGADTYGVIPAFSNTVGYEGYSGLKDDYSLLKLIRNDKTAKVHSKDDLSASDLFGDGASFDMASYKSQFADKGKLNSKTDLGWKFDVAISGTGNDATATLTLYRAL